MLDVHMLLVREAIKPGGLVMKNFCKGSYPPPLPQPNFFLSYGTREAQLNVGHKNWE